MQDIAETQGSTGTKEMSLFSRLANVFAAPGEVFDNIKSSPPRTVNWLIPTILLLVTGSVFIVTMFSNPAVKSQLIAQAEKRIDQMVERGTIPAQSRDQVVDQQVKALDSPISTVFGIVGYAFVVFAMLFGLSLVWWLIGRWVFKSQIKYGKVVEVVGLASTVSFLGGIVMVLLLTAFGSLYATPSLALAVIDSFDPKNTVHSLLASVNLFTLWYLGVTSVGLGKVYTVPTGKIAIWVFGLWAIYSIGSATISLPFF